jgi:hypothetical protein
MYEYIEMDENNYISDSLYTNTNKFLLIIDSRNARSYNNSTANSDLTFVFKTPIIVPKGALNLTCSVLAFTAPNSIYNINSYNNYIHVFYSNPSVEVKVYIPYGNNNSSTFMAQFVASALAIDTTLGTGLSITLNTVTNRFTVSHTSQSISFVYDSSIVPIIGLSSNMSLGYSGSLSNCLFPYT